MIHCVMPYVRARACVKEGNISLTCCAQWPARAIYEYIRIYGDFSTATASTNENKRCKSGYEIWRAYRRNTERLHFVFIFIFSGFRFFLFFFLVHYVSTPYYNAARGNRMKIIILYALVRGVIVCRGRVRGAISRRHTTRPSYKYVFRT